MKLNAEGRRWETGSRPVAGTSPSW